MQKTFPVSNVDCYGASRENDSCERRAYISSRFPLRKLRKFWNNRIYWLNAKAFASLWSRNQEGRQTHRKRYRRNQRCRQHEDYESNEEPGRKHVQCPGFSRFRGRGKDNRRVPEKGHHILSGRCLQRGDVHSKGFGETLCGLKDRQGTR